MLSRFSPYWLWLLLSLPALGLMVTTIGSDDPLAIRDAVAEPGEFAARFMIIAIMATPLALLFKGWRGPRWLVKNRRYFGVAAFAYAVLHLVFYLIDKGAAEVVVGELPRFYIWTGWLAFFIFIPLASTSVDFFVRLMGRKWKALHRWAYAAAILTLLHWAELNDRGGVAPAALHFAPLGLLTLYRLWYWYLRPRPAPAA